MSWNWWWAANRAAHRSASPGDLGGIWSCRRFSGNNQSAPRCCSTHSWCLGGHLGSSWLDWRNRCRRSNSGWRSWSRWFLNFYRPRWRFCPVLIRVIDKFLNRLLTVTKNNLLFFYWGNFIATNHVALHDLSGFSGRTGRFPRPWTSCRTFFIVCFWWGSCIGNNCPAKGICYNGTGVSNPIHVCLYAILTGHHIGI